MHDVEDSGSSSQLLLNKNLYSQSQSDFYYTYSLFSHYWNNGYKVQVETSLNTKSTEDMHKLACAMIFEGSNILNVIEEKDSAVEVDPKQVRTKELRS